jgi:hypothetical protein
MGAKPIRLPTFGVSATIERLPDSSRKLIWLDRQQHSSLNPAKRS